MASDSDSDAPTPSKHKSYDFKYKMEAIKYYEDHGCNKLKTAKQFKVARSRIQEWVRDKEKILKQL